MGLADYQLDDRVAATNMSEVWSATQINTGAKVAIKRRLAGDRAGRRFAREIQSQVQAAGVHTMPILAWDESYDWYAMPWAEGTLAEEPVPDDALAIAVAEAIADSLRPIHRAGQVHRDLKPENILWLDDDQPARWVVSDFGIVRNPLGATTATLTMAGGVLGTTGWMAPEQDGDAHDSTPRTDVYAVGAILSWILTGRRPRPGRVELPDHESPFRHVVWKATREHPGDRYTDVDEVVEALRGALGPNATNLADLVAASEFDAIVAFAVGNPSQSDLVIAELPRLSAQDVQQWYARDADGACAVVLGALESLIDEGVGELPYGVVDRFLSWSLVAVRADLDHNLARAERLAASLFRAIAEIHQFAPAKDVLEWLDRLSLPRQRVMENALRMADAWDFFTRQATGRFVTARTSPLVRRLSGDFGR